ncbi:hypothetical protein D3C77_564730 [compost metagenome]
MSTASGSIMSSSTVTRSGEVAAMPWSDTMISTVFPYSPRALSPSTSRPIEASTERRASVVWGASGPWWWPMVSTMSK